MSQLQYYYLGNKCTYPKRISLGGVIGVSYWVIEM